MERRCVALGQLIDAFHKDTPIYFTIEDAVLLTKLMEGAYTSWKTGKKVVY